MSKHHVFSSILKRPRDDHRYSADPFVALAELNAILEEAKKQTVREFSRKRSDNMGKILHRFYCIPCFPKKTFLDVHALLWGMEACCIDPIHIGCAGWRRSFFGKWRLSGRRLWVLVIHFPSTLRRPETSPIWGYLTIVSIRPWRHRLDHW